jgi:protein-S-isoprenylcysteine O-methyltransferase Ste14
MTETAGVKFPPPLLFAAGIVAGVLLDRALPLAPPPGSWRLIMGALLVAGGLLLDVLALLVMRRARTTVLPWGSASALVTRGPFALSRNPIYLGYALEHAGVALLLGSWWGLAMLAPVVVAMDRLVIPREERHLARVFGEAYAHYRARVRRWI